MTKELFAWGKYGGFGQYIRSLSEHLVKKGFDVYAVIPRSENQRPVEQLEGITVFGLPYPTSLADTIQSDLLARACAPLLFSRCRADIYHSVNPSFYTLLAKMARPTAKHLVAFNDLRDLADWRVIASTSGSATLPNRMRALPVESPFMKMIVQQADGLYAVTEFLAVKAARMYGLATPPPVVRHPYQPPKRKLRKADHPTVCFLGRLDDVKRPRIFFELARQCPEINFYVMGRTTISSDYYRLVNRYIGLSNLRLLGWAFGEAKSTVLERSWILVNTSIHEALPTAFLEAWGHECAVLSCNNPDGLVERFGRWVQDGDFRGGLKQLLEGHEWSGKGRAARRYVEAYHDPQSNIAQLIEIYTNLLSR